MSSTLITVRFYRVLVPLYIAYASYTIARRPFSVVRAEIQRETGLTTAHTSLVDTLFTIAYTLGQLNYIHFKMHFDNKQILLCGLLCSALTSLLVSFSSSLWIFCLAWSINGIAQAVGWATCVSILNAWIFPAERGSVMGWWSTNMAAGGVIGNVLPALLVSWGTTWRVALQVEVLLLFVVICAVSELLIGDPNISKFSSFQQEADLKGVQVSKSSSKNVDKNCGTLRDSPSTQGLRFVCSHHTQNGNSSNVVVCDKEENNLHAIYIFCHRGIMGICMSNFLHKLVRYTFIFWLPYYAIKELKCSTGSAGCISAMFDIGGIAGTIFSGYCSDSMFRGSGRTRVVLLFTGGMLLTTLSLAVFQDFFYDRVIFFALNVSLIGFFAFGIDALITGSFLLDFIERIKMTAYTGAVSGVVGGMGSAGSILQGVFTVILSSSSWSALFYSLSIFTLLGGICLYRPLHMEMAKRECFHL